MLFMLPKDPYRIYYLPSFRTEQATANSVDPDQTPRSAASDQGLYCLLFIQQYFNPCYAE